MHFRKGDIIRAIKYLSDNDKHLYELGKEYVVFGRGILKILY